MRRKYPPRKVVEILYKKYKTEKRYVTAHTRPKLLTGEQSNRARSHDHYAVCFEDTIVLEATNLQLTDEGNSLTFVLFDILFDTPSVLF
jgi:hypothetical protein